MLHPPLSRLFDHHIVMLQEVKILKLLFMEAFLPSYFKDTVFFPAFCLSHCRLISSLIVTDKILFRYKRATIL